MKKAIIFDVDGVLMDSVPHHFQAWQKAFADNDVLFTYQDYLDKVNGLPRLTGVRNVVPTATDAEVEAYAKRKQAYFLDAINDTPLSPLPGVVTFLKALQRRNIPFIAASSSKNARILLERAGISFYFTHILTGEDFTKAKPDPDIFLTAAQKMHIEPKYCVVIEDSIHGIQAAKNATMHSVGILSSQDKELKKAAHLTISSLEEYPIILQTYFG